MTLLAIEGNSLKPEGYIPIIKQTLGTIETKYLNIVIYLAPEIRSHLDTPAKRVGQHQHIQELVSALYVSSATNRGVSCNIIFADWCGYALEEELWDYSILCIPESSPNIVTRLPRSSNSVRTVTYLNSPTTEESKPESLLVGKDHPVVAVGGTFDHLHPGHKILLSITAYLSSRKLICGITDDALLKNKKFAEVLEPISLRIEMVRKFLTLIARNLELELVPINDVYGPTAYDPDISALVISEETKAGAQSISDLRKEKGLQELEVFIIDVIGEESGKLGMDKMAEEKMSSTKIRQRLAKATVT